MATDPTIPDPLPLTADPHTSSSSSATNIPPRPEPEPRPDPRTLRISTRSSALALAQTNLFTTLLASHPSPAIHTTQTSTHPIHTSLGDTNQTASLHTLAVTTGKSLWTEDLEHELLAHRVDLIVHSLKDVPTKLPQGLACSAVGQREESRDCVALSPRWAEVAERVRVQQQQQEQQEQQEQQQGEGKGKGTRDGDTTRKRGGDDDAGATTLSSGLEILPAGSVVGTSSIRRQAMIRRAYPHLSVKDVRGNVPTRFRKLDDPAMGFDAIVVAGAGVQRLGLGGRISGWLDRRAGWLHAVGQGAIGVEWREGDEWVEGLVEGLRGVGRRERRVVWEGAAERELLRVLEGGCSVPVGVECVWEEKEGEAKGEGEGEERERVGRREDGKEQSRVDRDVVQGEDHAGILIMRAMVVSVDGKQCVEGTCRHWVNSEAEAQECGWRMAQELVGRGAGEILKEITLNRDMIRAQDGA